MGDKATFIALLGLGCCVLFPPLFIVAAVLVIIGVVQMFREGRDK
jgi:hypothetical protein